VPAGDTLHDGRKDVASQAVGVALGLLLHLADQARAVVADLVLELAQQDLARLAGTEVRDLLELADLVASCLLEGLLGVVEVAPAVVERALPVGELLPPQLEGLLARQQALLEPDELRAPGAHLLLEAVAAGHCHLGVRAGRTVAGTSRRGRGSRGTGSRLRPLRDRLHLRVRRG
jgi:hypothetical protein